MSMETFNKVLTFIDKYSIQRIVLSGGEPTLHPDFLKIANVLLDKCYVTICTNGTNLEILKELCNGRKSLRNMDIQVYSHPDFYPKYKEVKEGVDNWKRARLFRGQHLLHFVDTPIQAMSDLGRAKTSEKAQEYIRNSPKYNCPSCMKAFLYTRFLHLDSLKSLFTIFNFQAPCHPLVDYEGRIHMSESHLCPHVGTIENSEEEILQNIKESKPCLACKNNVELPNAKVHLMLDGERTAIPIKEVMTKFF